MNTPSLKVVVAITSPIAFHSMKNQSILLTCIKTVQSFLKTFDGDGLLAIAGTPSDLNKISELECEKIACNPNNPSELATALQQSIPTELVMIHDSLRPLTGIAQFARVLEGLTSDIDAIRPVAPFTETLKSINKDSYIVETIDRNSMMRVSTPELFRFNAISSDSTDSAWFVPIVDFAKTATVDADSESARINSEKELELMSYLLDWSK